MSVLRERLSGQDTANGEGGFGQDDRIDFDALENIG